MMEFDLVAMAKDVLEKLKTQVEKALKSVDARRRAEAKKAAETAAKEFGFNLDELIGAGGPKATKGAPKYAHPQDASQTWTGRGRKPKWVVDWLASGKALDDLAI